MLYEYGRSLESSCKPYFDFLPSSFNTLIYWPDSELEELQANAILS